MKKSILIPFLGIVLLIGACKALHKLTQFHINYSSDFTVPSTLGVNVPLNITTPEITTNSEQQFKNNNTRSDMIESVKLDGMVITITSPSGQSLNFLNYVHLFLSAPGLSEVEVGYKDNIPDNIGNSLTMDLTNVELKEYLKKDKITLRVEVQTDKFIAQEVKVKVDNTFFVDAKILGL